MNAGPGGFSHAPVTKGVLLSSVGATLLSHVTRNSYRRMPVLLAHSAHLLGFRSSGEMLCGALLLYYFRVFERQTGSRKFGAYALAVTGMTYTLQALVMRLLHQGQVSMGPEGTAAFAGGPMPLIFASFVPFMLDIPASSHFTVGTWKLSDKAFVYALGLQLLLSSGRRSLLAGLCALTSGLLYRLDFMRIRTRFRLPSVVAGLVSRLLGPVFSDGSSRPTVMIAGVGGAPSQVRGTAGSHQGTSAGAAAQQQQQQQRQQQQQQQVDAAPAPRPPFQASQEALQSLLAMGFERDAALHALEQADNDVPTAISLLV